VADRLAIAAERVLRLLGRQFRHLDTAGAAWH
jgi:hypothetical protein